MSEVAGLSDDGVQLTGAGPPATGPALLQPESPTIETGTRRLRFEIEDVEEAHHGADNQHSLSSHQASLGYNTAEAVPMTVYYRHTVENEGKTRPSLDYLRERGMATSQTVPTPTLEGGAEETDSVEEPKRWWQCCKKTNEKKAPPKFGWIQGVLVRCLLNIWGVMLFIRLSWVVGQSGIGLASVIVLLAGVVTTITTLSMSAICTNGEVKGGGAYYLISRSLGPEFGGAIGIIFSLANAVAVSLYVVGFAETVSDLIVEYSVVDNFTGARINDIRVVGFIVVTLLLGVALIGLDWEAKVQIVLLGILLLAILDFVIGTFVWTFVDSEQRQLRGLAGYSGYAFTNNIGPSFQPFEGEAHNFFTIFAVFFPAATGILAGANISGDLKNPQTAIPKGTFLAIGISTVVYIVMAWMAGLVVIRNAPGTAMELFGVNMSEILDGVDFSSNEAYSFEQNFPTCDMDFINVSCLYGDRSPAALTRVCEFAPLYNTSCSYGLLNYFQVMEMVSGFGPLVTAGIFAATLSSALASLVGAPKVFQRVCEDKIFPWIHIFAKGGGRSGNEPIRGYVLTYIIALACIAIGDLNQIAYIISTFFLAAYALINYSCFAASFVKTPGWRPAFKFYNKWVALLGAVLCVAIMFVIRWYYALITIALVAFLYVVVDFLKPDINWGSSTQAFLYAYSTKYLLKLEKLEDHVKNFRPQFLVLSGLPSSRPDMMMFVSQLSKEAGIMICGHVLLGDYSADRRKVQLLDSQQRKWLRREKLKAFFSTVSATSFQEGTRSLLQLSGLGRLRPNTVVIGYKSNWASCPPEEVEEYVTVLHDAFDLRFGVMIFRLRAGFDATERHEEIITAAGDKEAGREEGTPPLGLHRRGTAFNGSDAGQPLLGERSTRGGFTEIPLVDMSSATPLVDSSPRLPQSTYRQIDVDLVDPQLEDDPEAMSLDSYTMAMESGERLDFDLDEASSTTESASDPILPPREPVGLPEPVTMPSRFEKTQDKGYIDVWWLYDDGGLAILLPYLLSHHRKWKNCKLRIFTASTRNVDQARLRMTSLLRKFRIDFSVVIEVHGISRKPAQESIDSYLSLPICGHASPEGGAGNLDSKVLDKMTLRHIRLGELLHEYSSDARLIVMTISVPQRTVSATQYMSWLEVMSRGLPPILMMRGNQSSVLTFYS